LRRGWAGLQKSTQPDPARIPKPLSHSERLAVNTRIQCIIRRYGSDTFEQTIYVDVLPRVGEFLFIGKSKNKVHSVEHEIDFDSEEHRITLSYVQEES
jgi:hypothetical protein